MSPAGHLDTAKCSGGHNCSRFISAGISDLMPPDINRNRKRLVTGRAAAVPMVVVVLLMPVMKSERKLTFTQLDQRDPGI